MKLPPLTSHSLGNTWKCFTSLFRPFGSRWEPVQSLLSSIYDVCRLQLWQARQPKAGGFCFTMPELPRLYDLVILAPDNFKRVFVRDWIFNSNQWDVCIHQQLEKLRALSHVTPEVTFFKPTYARIAKARAWRVCNHHIPSIIKAFQNIAFDMPFRMPTGTVLNIRTIRLMASIAKGYTNGLTLFASNQYFHDTFIQQKAYKNIAR